MKKMALRRSLLTMALAVSAVAWGAGVSHAYLPPIGPGDIPDYLTTPNWANSPPLTKFVDLLPGVPGLTSYNTEANGYNPDGTNLNDQAIYIATPDITSYPGSDFYEITLQEYSEQVHSDLINSTRQRGYVQTSLATDTSSCPGLLPACLVDLANSCVTAPDRQACLVAANTVAPPPGPHHLGPIIVAQKDRPVRIKFINALPTTPNGGKLFLPVDTSIMGAGEFTVDYDPVTKAPIAPVTGFFSQNRATLHLHGGVTPWISDGTPHQWITPAGEPTPYPRGVSAKNVPDMDPPGDGSMTFYYTNQQSARLMFYHDHSWGITRLNVYAGEAAGYMIQDPTEKALIANGIIPADQIPLVFEDKTFVDADTIENTDPTWAWGTQPPTGPGAPMTPVTGDLWWPHVYMPAQNPFDVSGIAPMGRWHYGPYFWPPTTNIANLPVVNSYYNASCDTTDTSQSEANTLGYKDVKNAAGTVVASFCQPPEIPGTPNPSWGAEAFMDTPLLNGTAYPLLKVEPKAYRLRILNASHDRFVNLQLYKADTDPLNQPDFGACPACVDNTEIRMVPALDYTAMSPYTSRNPDVANPLWPSVGTNPQPDTWAMDGRPGGAPDWNMVGPSWIQIGTEGGFLPKPVYIQNNPVTWNNDVTTFNAGNVNGGTLILGPAERADAIVDFSAYAGQTLILYNDAPAAFPALDPHYDYFTGNGDMTEAGGAAPTLAGLGPNIRTIMQIQVAATMVNLDPPVPFDQAKIDALNAAFATGEGTLSGRPVFAEGQHPIIVGQTAYNGIYTEGTPPSPSFPAGTASNPSFPGNYPLWGISRIGDNAISYEDVAGKRHTNVVALTPDYPAQGMEPKAIQDEMGEVYDDYGRMSAKMGLEMALTNAGIQTFVLQNYVDPSTEILTPDEVQIWKITHNGVDTHPLHFHLYDVQLLNRVGWDGFIRLPELNELGWKDTVKVSPLEDTIVALRPITPLLPFGVPESIRPLNPMETINTPSSVGFTTIDPLTGQARVPLLFNQLTNFDWEYVVHCHILSHEENDMMRTQAFLFPEAQPPYVPGLVVTTAGADKNLVWTDPTPATAPATQGNPANEIGFIVERAIGAGPYAGVAYVPANRTTYTDVDAPPGSRYRVVAYNAAGESPLRDSLGLFRPSTGLWYLDSNGDGVFDPAPTDKQLGPYGVSTDKAVVGDWDGDGKSEIGFFRPSNGRWYLDNNGNGTWNGPPVDTFTGWFGSATDIPVVGDWNGDGKSKTGFYRPSTGLWYLDKNGNGIWENATVDIRTGWYGKSTDIPVVGDWNGDGKRKIGFYRPSTGFWYLDMNGNGISDAFPLLDLRLGAFGQPTDIPVVGDWNGDGKSKIGFFRPSTGLWYLDVNGNGIWDGAPVDLNLGGFGPSTDIPVVGHW